MAKWVDARDLKSRGPEMDRAGSSPAPGTSLFHVFTHYGIPSDE